MSNILYKIAKKVVRFFYLFLDITGIMLGVFLIVLGLLLMYKISLPDFMGWLVLVIGGLALLIHLGHYFNLKIARWLFGSETYFFKDSPEHKEK